MIRVAVFGAGGRMGATVCAAVAGEDDLDLVAAVDPVAAGQMLGDIVAAAGAGSGALGRAAALEVAADGHGVVGDHVDVAVDFTLAEAAKENLRWCAANGVHAVCGTTGLSGEDLGRLRESFVLESDANCVLASNFSIGACLMMRCAELCAPFLDGVEVIELHHDHKRDAPSGTSLETVRRLESARKGVPFARDPTERETLPGTRGGVSSGGVHLHSVRLPGLVAHQEVIFGAPGETLSIRHDSTERVSFMPGVLLAVRKVARTPGLTIGLEPLLGL
ncbi:MAG: 4-hydroxy-tetrahydrodipicolinate reductase [Acidimicrobiales bacterium]